MFGPPARLDGTLSLVESTAHPGVLPLHVGHDAVPLEVQFAVATIAGLLASVLLLVAVDRQGYGDVVPLLGLAVLLQTDLLEISRRSVYVATTGLGIGLALMAKLVGIATFGTIPVPLMGADLLTVQELTGGVVIVVLSYLLGAYVLLPRFTDDVAAPDRVRRQWLVACAVYGVGFLVCVPLVTAVVPGT